MKKPQLYVDNTANGGFITADYGHAQNRLSEARLTLAEGLRMSAMEAAGLNQDSICRLILASRVARKATVAGRSAMALADMLATWQDC